jgi:hypothetical protein
MANSQVDEAVQKVGLHNDGRAKLAAGTVTVGPIHQQHVAAIHGFFRYCS